MEKAFGKTSKLRENSVKDNYNSALKDPDFKKLVNTLKVDEKEIIYNTTQLQDTVEELRHCKDCKGLAGCKNKETGFVNFPKNYNDRIVFSYVACKYQKEYMEDRKKNKSEDDIINEASMKDIDLTDKNRVKLIKWVANFIKKYNPKKKIKGLYLHGSFGCGKTFILSAMFNELKKQRYTTEIVYFPTLLRDLKQDFDSLAYRMDYLENVDLLLIDDIGAENVSVWSRDEILGTILQSRMNNNKATFFTSNFNIEELEDHLSQKGTDVVKARRIIERIKQLTEDMEIISINRR